VEKTTGAIVNVAGRVSWPLARGDQPLEGAILADNATIRRYQGQGLGELRRQGTPVAPTFLFVGGVMNLLWVAAIALFVLLEKALPLGDRGGRLAGWAMIAAGTVAFAAWIRS